VSAVWSQGEYARIAELFAPIHDDFVARMAPAPGERWLDVGTGTGAIAVRAAHAGAAVTAIDIADSMLVQARANADAAAVDVHWDLGDAQDLPYDDAAFDVVVSVFGVVFAPDRRAVASELARVCRRGGRLGLTAWQQRPEAQAVYRRFVPEPPEVEHTDWGREELVRDLLGEAFELELATLEHVFAAASPEHAWEVLMAAPPNAAFLQRVDEARHSEVRDAFVEYFRRFETPVGVREPRSYLFVHGTRR
jgi:SAM-dependent methyltransferase